jgi:hypothetical protein
VGAKKDLTGRRFGRLVAIKSEKTRTGRGGWRCKCDCGAENVVTTGNLIKGNSTSCGCLRNEQSADRKRKHGMCGSQKYRAWRNMISRCTIPSATHYPRYGGRGITVCRRWRESIVDFYADMGPKPTPKHTIDRIDNDGNYSCGKCEDCIANSWPLNCRWATQKEQRRNTSSFQLLEIAGESKCLTDWCAQYNVNLRTAACRLSHGRSIEQALGIQGMST